MECLQNKEGDWNDTGSNDIWRRKTAGSQTGSWAGSWAGSWNGKKKAADLKQRAVKAERKRAADSKQQTVIKMIEKGYPVEEIESLISGYSKKEIEILRKKMQK